MAGRDTYVIIMVESYSSSFDGRAGILQVVIEPKPAKLGAVQIDAASRHRRALIDAPARRCPIAGVRRGPRFVSGQQLGNLHGVQSRALAQIIVRDKLKPPRY